MDESSGLPPRLRWKREWSEKNAKDDESGAPSEQPQSTTEESPTEWTTIVLEVKLPASEERIPIEMDVNDAVLKLKLKILELQEMHAVPVARVVLQTSKTHVELLDEHLLKEYCALFEFPNNEIDVYLKPLPQLPQTVVLTVNVVPLISKEKIEIEVKAEESVAVLREKLEEVHRRVRFRLPTHGRYSFVHNQRLMNEIMSFRWHNVRQGDTIGTYIGYSAKELDDDEPNKMTTTTTQD